MASLQVASPQAEEVNSDAEEQTVMTPPAQNFDIEKPVHVIDGDDIDIAIIPRRDEGKQVEDLEDAIDEEEEDIGVKPAAQFDDDDDIEIIPRREQGKQVEDDDDAADEEEEDIGVKPAAQFDDDVDGDYEEPAGIRTQDDDDE